MSKLQYLVFHIWPGSADPPPCHVAPPLVPWACISSVFFIVKLPVLVRNIFYSFAFAKKPKTNSLNTCVWFIVFRFSWLIKALFRRFCGVLSPPSNPFHPLIKSRECWTTSWLGFIKPLHFIDHPPDLKESVVQPCFISRSTIS